MFSRFAAILTGCAIAIAFAATGSARAGIIVTVAKPAPEDGQTKKTRTASMPGYTGDRGATTSTPGTGASCTTDGTKSSAGCNVKLDPTTGLPLDWQCTPIGGGLVYCEDPAAGAEPGQGGAGSYDPEDFDETGLDDGEEMQAFGCAGGGSSTSGLLGVLGAIGGIVAMVRARRR